MSPRPEPGWVPESLDDLRAASERGLLEETHHLDIKRELAQGKTANRDAAKDMAALAIDGGLLIYGVDEDTTPPSVEQITVDGLAERIEQIALTAVSPPLAVETHVLASTEDPSRGALVVVIPPSPGAPHMVDGRYYGRSDKTNHHLSDADVRRLHRLHAVAEADVRDEALRDLAQSPVPQDRGVLVVIARPTSARRALLAELNSAEDWWSWFTQLVRSSVQSNPQYAPNLRGASEAKIRPSGLALSHNLGGDRRPIPDRHDRVVEVRLDDDGSVHVLSARAVETHPQFGDRVAFEALIVGMTTDAVALAHRVAVESGYRGGWSFAVAIGGLHGANSWALADQMGVGGPYTEDTYVQATEATAVEIESEPSKIVSRLVGRLLRVLGSDRLPAFAHLRS